MVDKNIAMKKLIVVLLFIFFISQVNSQTSKTEVLIEAGYNSAQFTSIKSSGLGIQSEKINSFNAGLRINKPLKKNFYLQTGLSLSGKGGKTEMSGYVWFYEKDTTNAIYLELPVNIIYKMKISKSIHFFVGAGMYGAMGIAGKNKYAGSVGDFFYYTFSGNTNLKFGKSTTSAIGYYDVLKQFDYGVNVLGGIEMNKLSFKINYSLGLTDISNNGNSKGKNSVVSFNIGYRIK
jgi:hypothetical protein